MHINNNKMAVLQQLELESEPIGLCELLSKLGTSFKERSVRRWLDVLAKEGRVQKDGQKRGTTYSVIKALRGPKSEGKSFFSSASLDAIEVIKKPLFERQPKAYSTEWFERYRPNLDYYLMPAVRTELSKSGIRTTGQELAGTYAHHIFNRLIIDLSYNSSRLEGNTYSLLDTERLLLHGDVAKGKLDEEKVMILNHKDAIRYLVDHAPTLEINPTVIRTLHYLLSDGLLDPSEAGYVRKHAVRIGGSTYRPFENTRKLEEQLEKILSKAALIQDSFEQSFFLLVHLSYLQAFIDVNKRTARLAANIPLIKSNLVPLSFNDICVEDYMSAMIAVYELQDVRPLTDLYFHSYIRTCTEYDSTVQAMGFDEIRIRYRPERRHVIREVVLQKLVGEKLKIYVQGEASRLIPLMAQEAFIEDVHEDLLQMDRSRIAGMGLTEEQLEEWKVIHVRIQELEFATADARDFDCEK